LAQIKQHPYYPFRNFRSDDLSFLLLEMYWAELFRNAVDGSEQLGAWTVQTPADREDGNPILHVINRKTRPGRALRVIQRFNTEGLPELDLATMTPVPFRDDAYVPFVPDLSRNALDDDGSTPIDELLISADVSPTCERLCLEWFRRWCVDLQDPLDIQAALDAYWTQVRHNLVQLPAAGSP
jgi:hypothetical protein